jgi:gluconolactonase
MANAGPILQMLDKGRKVEHVAQGGRFLEGPAFDREGTLWVVEIESGYVSRVEGKKIERVFQAAPESQPQSLAFHKDGRMFVIDRKLGIFQYDPKTKKISDLVRYFHNQNFKGPNDLVFDEEGNLWFTDPWGTHPQDPTGSVYFIETDGGYKKIHRMINNMAFPNGITLSPDGKWLYIAETRYNRLWRVLLDKKEGGFSAVLGSTYFLSGNGPDGMAVDEKGLIYVAHYNSGGVYVVSPSGEILEFIKVPSGRCTTNVAFNPGTKWLYITEACENNVWRVEVDNQGWKLFSHR